MLQCQRPPVYRLPLHYLISGKVCCTVCLLTNQSPLCLHILPWLFVTQLANLHISLPLAPQGLNFCDTLAIPAKMHKLSATYHQLQSFVIPANCWYWKPLSATATTLHYPLVKFLPLRLMATVVTSPSNGPSCWKLFIHCINSSFLCCISTTTDNLYSWWNHLLTTNYPFIRLRHSKATS